MYTYKKKKSKKDVWIDVSGNWDNVKDIRVFETDSPDELAYVTILKGHQSIFHWSGLNNNKRVRELIVKHELGHIYYNHLEAREQFLAQLRSYRTDLTRQQEDYILNVAMDMEINSTLLDLKEVEEIEKYILDQTGNKIQSVHPSRNGFPNARKTQEYLDRIMLDMENNPQENEGEGRGNGEGEDGEGNGSPQKGKGDGQKNSSSGKYGDTNITVNEEKYKELKAQQKEYGVKGSEEKGDQRGNQANVFGEISIEENLTAYQQLKRLIAPYMKRIHRSYRLDRKVGRDVYKNVLRGKTKIYVPSYKTKVERVYEKGAIDFLVDVSGSTDTDLNKKIVRDTFELIATPGKFMDIYLWNTSLVSKITAKDLQELEITTFLSGGGTTLADGIDYISKQSTDKRPLVIISDLEDNLDDWSMSLKRCGYNFQDVLILNHGRNPVKDKDLPEIISLPKEYRV